MKKITITNEEYAKITGALIREQMSNKKANDPLLTMILLTAYADLFVKLFEENEVKVDGIN